MDSAMVKMVLLIGSFILSMVAIIIGVTFFSTPNPYDVKKGLGMGLTVVGSFCALVSLGWLIHDHCCIEPNNNPATVRQQPLLQNVQPPQQRLQYEQFEMFRVRRN